MFHLRPVDRMRLERGAEHLCRLGPRATAEFLAELVAAGVGAPALLDRLDEYRHRLSPGMLRVLNGDRFPRRGPLEVPRDLGGR